MMYDVAVIGLGPSGLKFVREALKKGLNVIAFEKTFAGGTCLNAGCIPTKTMLSCAEVFSHVKNCSKYAVSAAEDSCEISWKDLLEKKNRVVQKLRQAVQKDLDTKGLTIVNAPAAVEVENSRAYVVSQGLRYDADKIIAATGSCPLELEGLKFNHDTVINSDDLLELESAPKTLLIIGSGAIGVEWARIFNSIGTQVTVVEKAPMLAPAMDIDIASRIERIFKMSKIKFYKSVTVVSYNGAQAVLSDGSVIECEKILCAAGRKRVLPEISNGFKLEVSPDCSTNVENLYVTGDASGVKMLAHAAAYQAKALFDFLYKNKHYFIPEIPSVIYGFPEIASIGMREQDIEDRLKNEYKIYKLPVSYLPKSWCDDAIDGFIKIIAHEGIIKGAHIVSKEASALISQIAIIMKAGLKVNEIEEIIFPHPTYSEGIQEAVLNG